MVWALTKLHHAFSFPNLIDFCFISLNAKEAVIPFGARRDLCSKGVNMLCCEDPACASRVWLMRLIVKGRLWFRKHCHYSMCFNIPHGFGVWFLFNTEQWLLYSLFHASLTITVVSKQTEAGPETPTQCYCRATVEVKLNIVIVWCHLS